MGLSALRALILPFYCIAMFKKKRRALMQEAAIAADTEPRLPPPGKVSNAQSHSRGSVYEEHRLLWFIAHRAASVMNLMCSRQSWRSEKL